MELQYDLEHFGTLCARRIRDYLEDGRPEQLADVYSLAWHAGHVAHIYEREMAVHPADLGHAPWSERKLFSPRDLHRIVKDAKTPIVASLAELVKAVEDHDNRYDQGLSEYHESVEKARAIVKSEALTCEKCATVLTNDSGALGICSKCNTVKALID